MWKYVFVYAANTTNDYKSVSKKETFFHNLDHQTGTPFVYNIEFIPTL